LFWHVLPSPQFLSKARIRLLEELFTVNFTPLFPGLSATL